MKKSLPFISKFSLIIGQLDDAGLLNYWYDSEIKKKININNKQFTALTLLHILAPFIVFLIGIFMSIMIFLLEYFHKKNI